MFSGLFSVNKILTLNCLWIGLDIIQIKFEFRRDWHNFTKVFVLCLQPLVFHFHFCRLLWYWLVLWMNKYQHNTDQVPFLFQTQENKPRFSELYKKEDRQACVFSFHIFLALFVYVYADIKSVQKLVFPTLVLSKKMKHYFITTFNNIYNKRTYPCFKLIFFISLK